MGEQGLIVAIISHKLVDRGKLQEGTGLILIPVKYEAIVVQMFKNEVVDCEVTEVSTLGFFGDVGPVRIFVSKSNMPQGWRYTTEEVYMGGGAAYVDPTESLRIRRETAVRVRLLAT